MLSLLKIAKLLDRQPRHNGSGDTWITLNGQTADLISKALYAHAAQLAQAQQRKKARR